MATPDPLRVSCVVAVSALWFIPSCFGQFETAAVLGTISDARGSSVPQARVALENLDTGTEQVTTTDAVGDYQFLEVRIDAYRVTAGANGFKKSATAQFRVEVGAR